VTLHLPTTITIQCFKFTYKHASAKKSISARYQVLNRTNVLLKLMKFTQFDTFISLTETKGVINQFEIKGRDINIKF
jgi:hypothetical protein